MADFKGMDEVLIEGNAGKVRELVQAAVDEGVGPQKTLGEGSISGMEVVGVRFKNCEIYVPEVLVSARAMLLSGRSGKHRGRSTEHELIVAR